SGARAPRALPRAVPPRRRGRGARLVRRRFGRGRGDEPGDESAAAGAGHRRRRRARRRPPAPAGVRLRGGGADAVRAVHRRRGAARGGGDVIDRTIWLVVERELRQALRSKGIWALVGLILLGATAVVVLPEVIPDGDDSGEVALVGEDAIGAADALRSLGEPELTIEELPDRAAATQAVEDGDVDLAVLLGGHADAPTVELLVEDESDELVRIV